ncbi:hypothetical protein [Tellurirhabdus rosea]|uniref:hypothetical protein n=1 Tax=Tellurirhabdus rosea TaxID=2674997 RepID=UPI002257A902|nr:hypothetical protein [Tellurirhabdus rosea]
MKYSKLFFLMTFAVATLFTRSVFAQYYPGGMGGMRQPGMNSLPQAGSSRPMIPNIAGELATKETKWLKDNLALDKEQAKAVKKLNGDYADQQQAAIKDIIGPSGQPGPDARKQIQDMMMMLNEEKEDKLKGILTAEQWKLYQTKKPEMQREVGGFRPPAPKEFQAKPDSAARQ